MKKLIALTLIFILVAALMTGCRNPMDEGETESSGEDSVPSTSVTTPSTSVTIPTNSSAPTNTTNSPNITLPTDPSNT
ncbi:MAG: hypothetical protein IJV82_05675 [Oscillospiraceae bacterium]|nr:hypothetical protein [Oscillospiraceae bacterium]